jgi:hypothetical protein
VSDAIFAMMDDWILCPQWAGSRCWQRRGLPVRGLYLS